MTLARKLTVLSILLLTPPVLAQNQWSLTTADFVSQPVELRVIDQTGVAVTRSGAAQQNLPWDQVLQLTRQTIPKVAPARFALQTSSGETLNGAPVRIENEKITWSTPSLGEITVPLREALSVTRTRSPSQSKPSTTQPATDDTVSLSNGDQVRGIVSDMGNGKVSVQSGGTSVAVPLESVETIQFAATAQPQRTRERGFRVRFADGSTVRAADLKLAGDQLTVGLADQSTRQLDVANVASIEQVNGPVAWLSALESSENVHTPYLHTPRPARMDRAVTGDPIRFGERTYARGIGVYPYSRLTWTLDGTYAGFRTQYAIEGAAAYANVTVRIKLDGNIVHEQPAFTAGSISPVISIPVGSAKTLTLEVDYGQNFSVQDRFNWIEPALTKTVTPPTTQP